MHTRWTTQQASVPPMTPAVFRLLVVFSLAFLALLLAHLFIGNTPLLFRTMALQVGPGFHPLQLLTFPYLSGPPGLSGLLHLLFEGLVLWSFGSELERLWGSHNFLKFFLTGIAGGLLLATLLGLTLLPGMTLYGFGAGLTAILVAYAMIWPDRQALFFMVIPIRMKWLILILLIFLAFMGSLDLLIYNGGGALAGALFLFYYARRGRMHSGFVISSSARKGRGLLERIADSFRRRRLKKKQEEIDRRINMKEEVDRLLEKISREGIHSLTRKERAFLDKASKEM